MPSSAWMCATEPAGRPRAALWPVPWPARVSLLLAAGLLVCVPPARSAELEAKVKAAYVFHVIKFVDWPALPGDTLTLCISGSDAVSALLGDLAGKPVKERPLRILPGVPSDPAQCQVLYVGGSERRWVELQPRLRNHGVLTVSDQDGFARNGGIIGFYPEAGRIRLEINPEAARQANLRISAKLLELARTVP